MLLTTGSLNLLNAQMVTAGTPSDTLVVLWSSGNPEVAVKACLMYTHTTKKTTGLRRLY